MESESFMKRFDFSNAVQKNKIFSVVFDRLILVENAILTLDVQDYA